MDLTKYQQGIERLNRNKPHVPRHTSLNRSITDLQQWYTSYIYLTIVQEKPLNVQPTVGWKMWIMSWLSIGTNIYYNYPALQCSSLIPHQQSKNEIKVIFKSQLIICFRDTSDYFAVYISFSFCLSSWEKSCFYLSFLLSSFVCNVFLYSPSVKILVQFWSIFLYLFFGYHSKLSLWSPKEGVTTEYCEANNIAITQPCRIKVDMSESQRELKETTFKLTTAWETTESTIGSV